MGALPSGLILGTLALIATLLAIARPSPPELGRERNSASAALAIATSIQAVHFVEEALLGFHIQFPAFFGLPPIPFLLFVVFNLACLFVWVLAAFGIKNALTGAFAAAWFLVLAGILNGLAHPGLALISDGYFPGLVTSLAVAIACAWLSTKLLRATRPHSSY